MHSLQPIPTKSFTQMRVERKDLDALKHKRFNTALELGPTRISRTPKELLTTHQLSSKFFAIKTLAKPLASIIDGVQIPDR